MNNKNNNRIETIEQKEFINVEGLGQEYITYTIHFISEMEHEAIEEYQRLDMSRYGIYENFKKSVRIIFVKNLNKNYFAVVQRKD